VGIEGGLLCLSIFLIFLIKTMKKTYGSMKKVNDPNLICLGHAIFTALVGFLVMSMTLSSPKVKYLWVLLGMALVYSSIIEDGRTSENNKYFS
jgi:O-antigen ligase